MKSFFLSGLLILVIILFILVRYKYDYFSDFEPSIEPIQSIKPIQSIEPIDSTSYLSEIWQSIQRIMSLSITSNTVLESKTDGQNMQKTNVILVPDQCVDLYELTKNPMFKTKYNFDNTYYDVQYCIDQGNDGSIEKCTIGRFIYDKAKQCWIFVGNLADISKDINHEVWDGQAVCPFNEDCDMIKTYFADSHQGYYSMDNGHKYFNDGKKISRIF